jgi:hypothetical protein
MAYDLTPEQRAIIAHDRHNHARVLAGPGTGKSATVVALVDELLAANPAPRIKLITFTLGSHGGAREKGFRQCRRRCRTSFDHAPAGTGNFPKPALRIVDDWEDKNIVRPTLARRIHVRVDRLKNPTREMASKLGISGAPTVAQGGHPRSEGSSRSRMAPSSGCRAKSTDCSTRRRYASSRVPNIIPRGPGPGVELLSLEFWRERTIQ